MTISILGGKFKGQKLKLPPEKITRPTSAMLKRKIFDAYQNLSEVIFVDLFAGSGSICCEAISRGAKKTYINEINKKSFKILNENLSSFKGADYEVQNEDALKYLKFFLERVYLKLDSDQKENTIIYIDPPYENIQMYKDLMNQLNQSSFNGVVWLETSTQKGIKAEDIPLGEMQIHKSYEHSNNFILVIY